MLRRGSTVQEYFLHYYPTLFAMIPIPLHAFALCQLLILSLFADMY